MSVYSAIGHDMGLCTMGIEQVKNKTSKLKKVHADMVDY
jgi:hypothetical protein